MKKVFSAVIMVVTVLVAEGCALLPGKQVSRPSQIIWEGVITLDRDTVIPPDTTLIIKAGTRVQFTNFKEAKEVHPEFPGVELIVLGRIMARGTKEQPIFFTAQNTRPASMGSWGAVNLSGGQGGEFAYCQFEFAETGLHCQSTSLKLTNCRFFYNQMGLRFSDTNPVVVESVFFNNDTAIQYHNASPQILNCQITFNRVGIFCRFGSRNSRIVYNNIFSNDEYSIKLGEEQIDDLFAAENYWGATEPQATIYDGNQASYIGKVLFVPQAEEKFPLAEDLL